jgi:hypothetical protein
MNLNGNKYTYKFFRVSKHPTSFPPEDEEVEDPWWKTLEDKDPLQRAMEKIEDEEVEDPTS